ncbi:hypothetical protein DFH09DRAFT_1292028 [Mycena vulgaris]|nr:hypothetical protein DFH09DRAFT_1292028 [Mycena vulgaris]
MESGPRFPPELEREIFREAAWDADSWSITQFLLVCHRVHIWTEPFLYRVLLMNTDATISGIAEALKSKPASFFEKAVSHLWLVNFSPEARDTSLALLQILPRIENLVIMDSLYPFSDPEIVRSIGGKCTRLGLVVHAIESWYYSSSKRLSEPIYSFVTHLIIHDARGGQWSSWSRLAELPALTHLCLAQKLPGNLVHKALEECPRLHVVVRLWFQRQAAEADYIYPRNDSRLVVMWLPANYRADWENGVYGGDDFWARAEQFLERKMRGEIEKLSRPVPSCPDIHISNQCYFYHTLHIGAAENPYEWR